MNEPILREFERKVLDQAYLTHPIWTRNKNKIIYSLFAAFDSMLLPFITIPEKSTGQLQFFKTMEEGFVQALAWYNQKFGIVKPTSTPDRELISTAGDFLVFCTRYALVAHFHMLFGKKLCTAEIDKDLRTVTFIPASKEWDGGGAFGQGSYVETMLQKKMTRSVSDEAIIPAFENLSFTLIRGRVVFNDYSFLADQPLKRKATASSRIEQLYLSNDTKLCGFTLLQFDNIMEVLQVWAFTARTIYLLLSDEGTPQEDCMPTQLIKKSDFTKILSRYAEVDEQTVQKVVALLSFGSVPKPDVYLQPFYVAEEMCLWSPFVLGKTKSKRNLLKLVARMPSGSAEIANINGSREATILHDLGLFFAKRGGYSYKLNTRISDGPDEGEIDMLIYHPKASNEIMIIEAKCVLPVDDVNEMCSATNEMIKAQDQIRKAWKILAHMSVANKKRLYPFVEWEKVTAYYGLVVTPESYPSRNYVHDEIPATTIQILKFHLKAQDIKKPSTICSAFKKKSWAEKPISENISYEEITIGDVIYRIPGVELNGKSDRTA